MAYHKKYTISRAAKILNISKSTLRRWMKHGKIASTTDTNGTHFFDEDVLKKMSGTIPKSLPNTPASPPFLPPSQAAAKIGVSKSTLLRYERAGLITSTRTAQGTRRYRIKDLEKLARSHTPYQKKPAPVSQEETKPLSKSLSTALPPDPTIVVPAEQSPLPPTPPVSEPLIASITISKDNKTDQILPNPPPEPLPAQQAATAQPAIVDTLYIPPTSAPTT